MWVPCGKTGCDAIEMSSDPAHFRHQSRPIGSSCHDLFRMPAGKRTGNPGLPQMRRQHKPEPAAAVGFRIGFHQRAPLGKPRCGPRSAAAVAGVRVLGGVGHLECRGIFQLLVHRGLRPVGPGDDLHIVSIARVTKVPIGFGRAWIFRDVQPAGGRVGRINLRHLPLFHHRMTAWSGGMIIRITAG